MYPDTLAAHIPEYSVNAAFHGFLANVHVYTRFTVKLCCSRVNTLCLNCIHILCMLGYSIQYW